MKHAPVISARQALVSQWAARKPVRQDYDNWSDWMQARGNWSIDMAHALEHFDRRERWAREGTFCDAVK
jgi:hypothetical protein